MPNGTATWEGDYEGIYQLGDETGVRGETTDDSGTASIEVDFTTMENAVTVTLTSDTTDAKTLPGGSDSSADEWTPEADLSVTTFDNDRVNSKPSEDDDAYVKIAGALFGQNGEALAGVYEFDYQKDHPTDTYDGEAVRVNDIRGAGWFGGCKDVTDFSCFDPDPVTDPDPMDDPMDDPMAPPMDGDPPMTPPDTDSYLSFGAWADRPADFDAFANNGDFDATLQVNQYYYLRGTRTSEADMDALPTTGTVTWAGTYVGQYRTNPVDDPITEADESVWSALTDDSGTVSMVFDLSGTEMDITLTSTVGNTFPGVSSNVHTPKSSFAFDSNVNFSGNDVGGFFGDHHDTDESGNNASGRVEGAFFGSGLAEAGGVYSITQGASLTQQRMETQVEAVGVFGATKQ